VARVSDYYDFGDPKDMDFEQLIINLERMYTDIATALNSKPDLYERDTDGLVSDTFLAQGSININSTTRKVQMLTAHTSPTAVIWTTLS